MDSDLAESISALKDSFARRRLKAVFGQASRALVQSLTQTLRLPKRYQQFLLECDPVDVETRTPAERVRLVSAQQLTAEQLGFALSESGRALTAPSGSGWRPSWIIIAHSALLGDPYFLDTATPDAEGDCQVFTAMAGTDSWQPQMCASSFATFLRILAVGMELASGFADDDTDIDDEQVFREALGPRIREYDPAALKAGHWT